MAKGHSRREVQIHPAYSGSLEATSLHSVVLCSPSVASYKEIFPRPITNNLHGLSEHPKACTSLEPT